MFLGHAVCSTVGAGAVLWPLGGAPSRQEKCGKPWQVAWGHGGVPGHRQTPWLRTEGWAAQSGAWGQGLSAEMQTQEQEQQKEKDPKG